MIAFCRRRDLATALTAKMWSYWHSAPAGPGVFDMLLGWCKSQASSNTTIRNRELGARTPKMTAALHVLASNELKAWPRMRVTGSFVFVKEASDGAALLVECGTQTVYKVLGISTSLGDLLRANGQSLPQCIGLTLLPFMGVIAYDGTLRGMPLPPPLRGRASELAATVDKALADGSLISALPTPTEAPLEGKPVRISGLQAKPALNGEIANAGEFDEGKGRYAVRLGDGTRVALKPANLCEVSEAEALAAAEARSPGTVVGSELTPFQRAAQAEIKATPHLCAGDTLAGGSPDGSAADLSFWVFRRYGYSESQNPEHTFMVMAGPLPIPAKHGPPIPPGVDPMMAMMMGGMGPDDVWHKASALVPAVDDILKALCSALKNPMWGGRGKPKSVAVDAKEIVGRLQEILAPAGIEAGYYPPPSNEELMTMGPGADVGGGV